MADRGFRNTVLSDVRRALGEGRRQPTLDRTEPISEGPQNQLSSFAREFENLGGAFLETALPSEAADYVCDLIDSLGITRVALSDAKILDEISLEERIRKHVRESGAVARVERSLEKRDLIQLLGTVELGITSCRFAIAQTGTLVLETENEMNRLLSLLPPVHVVILRPGQLVGTLGEVIGRMNSASLGHAVTLITGPSRTADIELTLTKGVHGPREIYAIFLGGDEAVSR